MNTSEQVKWRTVLLLKLLPFKYRRRLLLLLFRLVPHLQPLQTRVPGNDSGGSQSPQFQSAAVLKWRASQPIHSRRIGTIFMDIMLVRQLMVDQPFSVPFGRSGEAWRACARSLSLAKDPDGMLVFGKFGVSDKAIKKRFDDLMAFMKNHQDNVPFQSGCDDEPERTELQGALEDLYEIYASVITELKEASNSAAAKKADDRQKAEALRNASLGILSPNEKSHYIANKKRNDSSSDSGGGRSEKKPRKTTRETRSIIDLTSARLEERTAIMLSKEARKKERQEFKAKQQELEFQFKVEQAEKAHELQRMQLELQTEMMRFFRQQNQPTADVEGKQNDSNSK